MRQRLFRIAVFPIALCAVVMSMPLVARAILAELSLPDLVQMSDHIVRAKVLSTSSAWNDDRTQILTTVIIRIDESYSGRLADSSQAMVMLPGGVVDGLAMEVEHSPVFVVGEDVIVFLTDIDNKHCRVSGWEAGKFSVENGRVVENGLSMLQFKKQIEIAVKSAGQR